MAINAEEVKLDILNVAEFDENQTYVDGTPLSATNLNKPVKTLKRELNHVHWLIHQLMSGSDIPAVKSDTTYSRNTLVTQEGYYYISIEHNALGTGDLSVSSQWKKILVPGAAGGSIQELLTGTHPAGGVYENAFLSAVEQTMISYSSTIEYNAEIHRLQGASGIFSTRQYTYDQPFDPKERIFGVTYNSMGQHNHPNYRGMPGTAELSLMANGYYTRTRHNDYRIYAPVQGGYTARKEILAPEVPASVLALPVGEYTDVASATPTTQYSYMKNIHANHPQDCIFFLSYAEVWWEDFTGGTGDYTDSFHHSTDADTMKDMIEKAIYLNAGGHKNRFENIAFSPVIVRRVTDTGQPVLAALRYRINSFPVASLASTDQTKTFQYSDGTEFTCTIKALPFNESKATVGELDPDNMFALRKDLRQTMRDNSPWVGSSEWASMIRSGRATFDLQRFKLRELCELLPGMMGQGASILESYDQYGLQDNLIVFGTTNTPLNAAYYNHRYSMVNNDASGRTSAHRSFNDPNLFVAKTDDAQVVDGFSYMVPLELILRTPRENWNPYGLDVSADPDATGNGSTSEMPLNGWNFNRYNFTIPRDLYAGGEPDGTDAADTSGTAWVTVPEGQLTTNTTVNSAGVRTKLFWGSGIRIFDASEIDGTLGHRMRFAIFPEYQDYSKASSDLELYKKAMREVLTKVVNGTATQDDVDAIYRDAQTTL